MEWLYCFRFPISNNYLKAQIYLVEATTPSSSFSWYHLYSDGGKFVPKYIFAMLKCSKCAPDACGMEILDGDSLGNLSTFPEAAPDLCKKSALFIAFYVCPVHTAAVFHFSLKHAHFAHSCTASLVLQSVVKVQNWKFNMPSSEVHVWGEGGESLFPEFSTLLVPHSKYLFLAIVWLGLLECGILLASLIQRIWLPAAQIHFNSMMAFVTDYFCLSTYLPTTFHVMWYQID